jgi:hypothetical protein
VRLDVPLTPIDFAALTGLFAKPRGKKQRASVPRVLA